MKTTTAESDPTSYSKLQEMIRDIDVAMVTTVTVDGALRSRPMVTREFEADGIIWFFTSDDSGKARDLNAEHAVNLSYAQPNQHRYVSVTGNATIIHDREKAKTFWTPSLKTYFPRGLEDPHLALLRVSIETAEMWDASKGRMTPLFGGGDNTQSTADVDGHTKLDVRASRESG